MHPARCLPTHKIAERSLLGFGLTSPTRSLRGVVASLPHTTSSTSTNSTVRRQGDLPYGSRQYLLMQSSDDTCLASLRAHRNVLFAATKKAETKSNLADLCRPLVQAALEDASAQGEQPQALATLHGLCSWVSACLNGEGSSQTLQKLKEAEDLIALEAVRAIATGKPRPGHSVVGPGTFQDGNDAWRALAREFAPQSLEVELYRREGADVVGIELLTHTREEYLKSAGGAMARMFFL